MKKNFGAGLLVLALLLACGLACGQGKQAQPTAEPATPTVAQGGSPGAGQGGLLGGGQPIVRFLSPPGGTQVALGSQVYLQARAFARAGLNRVEFAANGTPIGTQTIGGTARLYTAAQAWSPEGVGSYTLSATAYDASGQASAPAQVMVMVQQSFAPPAGGGEGEPAGGEEPPASGSEGEPAGGEEPPAPEPEDQEPEDEPVSGGQDASAQEASVAFWADRTQIAAGESTVLHWDVENVREVYLDGEGVVGHDSREVWPVAPAQTYVLHVVLLSGEGQDQAVTIEVSGEQQVAEGPDLIILAVDCPDTREPDETIPFQAEVLNAGDTAARGAQWRWSVARAGAGPGSWNMGGQFDLEPGQVVLLQGSAEPHDLGHWTVHVQVRVDGETSPGDNSGSDALTIMGDVPGPEPVPEAPWAPINCHASQVNARSVYITWGLEGMAPPVDGYRVYLAVTDLIDEEADPNWGGFIIRDLEPNTSYHFDVRTYTAGLESPADACALDVTTAAE